MLKTTLKSWKDNTLYLQEETWLQGMQFSQLHQHVHLHRSIRSHMVKLGGDFLNFFFFLFKIPNLEQTY